MTGGVERRSRGNSTVDRERMAQVARTACSICIISSGTGTITRPPGLGFWLAPPPSPNPTPATPATPPMPPMPMPPRPICAASPIPPASAMPCAPPKALYWLYAPLCCWWLCCWLCCPPMPLCC